MDETTSTELTLKDLLEPAPDEIPQTTDWEVERADADMEAALGAWLAGF